MEVIASLKVSDFIDMPQVDRKLFRITGKIDPQSRFTSGKDVLVYSEESRCATDESTTAEVKRYELIVDTEYLDEFNLHDINFNHDLIQFLGYKAPNGSLDLLCKMKAMHFRVIKRTNLKNYYAALDIQNSYITTSTLASMFEND